MPQQSGRCFCGQVTWVTEARVRWAGHCHCDSCRRATSAPFTSFFGVNRRKVIWGGTCAEHLTSDGAVRRGFCPRCGTQMYYQNDIWPNETHLYAATMDAPETFEPEAHYHFLERLDWVEISDDLPKYPKSADISEPLP